MIVFDLNGLSCSLSHEHPITFQLDDFIEALLNLNGICLRQNPSIILMLDDFREFAINEHIIRMREKTFEKEKEKHVEMTRITQEAQKAIDDKQK